MQETTKSFREQVARITGKSLFIVAVIALSLVLSVLGGQLGTLLLYIVVLATLWAGRWNWSYFGITRPNWPKTILKAFLLAIGLFILNDFVVQPLIEFYFGKVDLSDISQIEGSLPNYALFIALGWIFGGLCEEIIFRGYVLKRLAVILGDSNWAWVIAAVLASIVFGAVHNYQGLSGVITAAAIALFFGIIFILNKKNLFVLIFVHGVYNTIAITLIYLGKARAITDWVHGILE